MAPRDTLRNARLLIAATFLSRALGLARDMLSAAVFGAGLSMSAFVLAFTIPNLFRAIFGEGALTAAFVPVYTELGVKNKRAERDRLLSVIFTWLLVILSALTALAIGGSEIARRFFVADERNVLFLGLLETMLPYALLICLVALMTAALQTRDRFFFPALSPVALNLVWIAALLLLAPRFGIYSVAAAITFAGALQLGLLLWEGKRAGLAPRLGIGGAGDSARRVIVLMGPIALGMAATRISVLTDRLIAWICIPGEQANAVLYFADRLMELPVGLIGIALGTAVFPALARHAGNGDRAAFAEETSSALRISAFLALPTLAIGVALAAPLISLVYQRGDFTADSASRAAPVLVCYLAGVWAFCGVQVLTRAFYALQDTRTPVRIMFRVVLLDVILCLALVWRLEERALALAMSLAGVANFLMLFHALRARMPELSARATWISFARCGVCAAAGGIAAWTARRILGDIGDSLHARLIELVAPALAGMFIFTALGLIMRLGEWAELRGAFRPSRQK